MDSAPPKLSAPPRPSATAVVAASLLVAAGAAAAAIVFLFDPSSFHFYPVCEFHQITGLNCPGCGGTRALYALLHGEFSAAVRDNALFVVGATAVAIRAAWFGLNRLRGRANGSFFRAGYVWPLVLIIGAFGVLRNLPVLKSYLSP